LNYIANDAFLLRPVIAQLDNSFASNLKLTFEPFRYCVSDDHSHIAPAANDMEWNQWNAGCSRNID
jgi:hypothetical protein